MLLHSKHRRTLEPLRSPILLRNLFIKVVRTGFLFIKVVSYLSNCYKDVTMPMDSEEAMQRAEVSQAQPEAEHVAKAKQKLVNATTEMNQEIEKENGHWLIYADSKLLQARRLLEEENAIENEKLNAVLAHLAFSWNYIPNTQGSHTHELKNPLRDAMTLIAVSISGTTPISYSK